jgi:hypothetical protein
MLGQIVLEYLSGKDKALRYKKNIRSPFPDLGFKEGQTNCFKKRSEKLFLFSKTFKKIYKLFFQAAIIIDPRHDIPSQEISFPGGHQRVWDGNLGDVLSILGLRFSRQMMWYHKFSETFDTVDELEILQV